MANNVNTGMLVAADVSLTLTAEPVPTAVWLLGSGLVGLILLSRRPRSDLP